VKKAPPDSRAHAQRAALNALKRAGRAAARAGVELSEWEGEFLGSVTERIKTYGRAFADPDKGAMGAPLSMMQAVKLKEITAKAKGEKPKTGKARPQKPRSARKPFGRRAKPGHDSDPDA
jgi:hypothetical protein